MAAAQVMAGESDMAIGGGVEAMSRVPMGSDGGAWPIDPAIAIKTYFVPQGISADLIATKWGFSRDDVDAYAVESQKRAARRLGERLLQEVGRAGEGPATASRVLDHDETMRPDTDDADAGGAEARPSRAWARCRLRRRGRSSATRRSSRSTTCTTPATRSGIVDGAAAVLLGTKEAGEAAGLKPRARIRAFASIGSEPSIMLTGPALRDREAAQARRHEGRRHRPLRAERGLRRGRAALHAGADDPARQDQRQRRRHRHGPPAGRHRRDDPGHRCSTRLERRRARRSSRCASAPAWAPPPSSNAVMRSPATVARDACCEMQQPADSETVREPRRRSRACGLAPAATRPQAHRSPDRPSFERRRLRGKTMNNFKSRPMPTASPRSPATCRAAR